MEEDRGEFDQVLREALEAPGIRRALRGAAQVVTAEQLRARAFGASALIAAAAHAEYQEYVRIREAARLLDGGRGDRRSSADPALGGRGQLGAALAVLVPVLGGVAAAVFLLIGYGLRLFGAWPQFAGTLVATGWATAGIAAVVALSDAVGLLAAAARNGAEVSAERTPDVERVRVAWRAALLERGMLPYLHGQLPQKRSARVEA
ncbi:hypothetical protein ACFOSC_30045 [Streptantibioticus rubrisoli]|uniref:Uncharacterized protein n=1 Tax=Streptantibioticus rubrisoli TaxID=1387313 RepID=A0ABT1P7R3_9ACTN|nr:hypothetical protein [Streptantibioticus rubrisoli]MCQ4041390.1 hypothetical protein [Streptantibioticus rubrisoli]